MSIIYRLLLAIRRISVYFIKSAEKPKNKEFLLCADLHSPATFIMAKALWKR